MGFLTSKAGRCKQDGQCAHDYRKHEFGHWQFYIFETNSVYAKSSTPVECDMDSETFYPVLPTNCNMYTGIIFYFAQYVSI